MRCRIGGGFISPLHFPWGKLQRLSTGLQISFSEGKNKYLEMYELGQGPCSSAAAKLDRCVMAGCTCDSDQCSANYGRDSWRAKGLCNWDVNEGMGGCCALSSVSIFGCGCWEDWHAVRYMGNICWSLSKKAQWENDSRVGFCVLFL